MSTPLWEPSSSRIAASHLTRFSRHVESTEHVPCPDYASLHRWSIEHAPEFWARLWDYCAVIGDRGERLALDPDRMPGARFLPDATLNFTENLLRRRDDGLALLGVTEDGRERRVSWAELFREVSRAAAALRRSGVGQGDRVCGMVANVPEAVIAALATAAIGAIWSSCSPDFGADGVVDRFAQVTPGVLIVMDGYTYGGKHFDCLPKVAEIAARIPGLRTVVVVPLAGGAWPKTPPVETVGWREWLGQGDVPDLAFERFPFNHPLYILYSSGTTGAPKCIVHGAGGTLLQHMKEHQLQSDIRPDDRVLYFTTCGWMMWNWLVTALASGAAIVLYEGSPFHPDGRRLFDLADSAELAFMGLSARFIDSVKKADLRPVETHRLKSVRTIASTGSPLAPESFDFVYQSIKRDVHLASISGGTDIVSCFMLGNPNGPVWRGELQAPGLGLDVRVFDPGGQAVVEQPGELVCTRPFPAMPIGFWNDPESAKYHAAYFERFPDVWCHGDWVRATTHGGFIIYGRSDATLNPGGVRIGTAEIYRQVEQFPEVLESLVVGQHWDGDERVVLFVRLAPGAVLDDGLRKRLADRIRTHTSPRHVPARIVAVGDIPRTRSGKLVELAVRRVIHGEPIDNREALANPEALDLYRDLPELRA